MTEIRYRVIFKDGSHGAWSTDKERTESTAKFFRATVETWTVKKEER